MSKNYLKHNMQLHAQHLFLIICIFIPLTSQTADELSWINSHALAPAAATTISLITCGYLIIRNCRQKNEIQTLRTRQELGSPLITTGSSTAVIQERIDTIARERNEEREKAQRAIDTLARNLFNFSHSRVEPTLSRVPELLDFKDGRNRTLLHHAMIQHHIPILAAIFRRARHEILLDEIDNDGRTPRDLVSYQKNDKSLLEATHDATHIVDHITLCKQLIELGAGDFSATSQLFTKSSIKSYAQQKICLHELRIRQNLDQGCLICRDTITKEDVVLHDCCYTCFHRTCSDQARVHNTDCPKCRKPFAMISETSLQDQTRFADNLQIAFSQ